MRKETWSEQHPYLMALFLAIAITLVFDTSDLLLIYGILVVIAFFYQRQKKSIKMYKPKKEDGSTYIEM